MAGDQYWYNKVLGLHCDGTNGSTTFTDVKGKTVTAYGNAQISTAQYPSLTGKSSSAYIDGTGDYLGLSNTSDFDFGSGDFLVRMRFRADSVTGNRILIHRGQAAGYSPWAIYLLGSNLYAEGSVTGSSWAYTLTGSTTLSTGTWYVAELYRYGTEVGIRVDGARDAYTTVSGSLMVSTASPRIGANSAGTNEYSGYISEIEIYKGTCVNTADYTPTSLPFADEYVSVSGTTKDENDAFASRLVLVYRRDTGALVGQTVSHPTTGEYKVIAADSGTTTPMKHFALTHDASGLSLRRVLGLHCDGANNSTTFTDVAGNSVTANGNAKISTAQYPALTGKTSSAYFDGTNSVLSIPDSSKFATGALDFTVRMRIRFSTVPGAGQFAGIFGQRTDGASQIGFSLIYSDTDKFYVTYSTSGTSPIHITGLTTFTPTVDTWYALDLVRAGSYVYIIIDGTKGTTINIGTASFYDSSAELKIGAIDNPANYFFHGYMSEVEFFVGVATNTANYTPSSDPFTDTTTATENALIYDDITPV